VDGHVRRGIGTRYRRLGKVGSSGPMGRAAPRTNSALMDLVDLVGDETVSFLMDPSRRLRGGRLH